MKRRTAVPPGIITLCVIFISLCISVMALLTFRDAQSELNFARASADQRYEVLNADWECRTRIEKALLLISEGRNIEDAALETDAVLEDNNLVFEQRVDDSQVIRAEVQLGSSPRLVSYETLYTAFWSPDETIEVWDGGQSR